MKILIADDEKDEGTSRSGRGSTSEASTLKHISSRIGQHLKLTLDSKQSLVNLWGSSTLKIVISPKAKYKRLASSG